MNIAPPAGRADSHPPGPSLPLNYAKEPPSAEMYGYASKQERVVNLLAEYLERVVQLETLAASESDHGFKDQLLQQAASY